MKTFKYPLLRVESDLGLNAPFIKGQAIHVENCWHFSTDGNAVDAMFYDEQDFRDAMNRIYVTMKKYKVIILAFCLMDTHIHFILYGDFSECNLFMHEFINRTSRYISFRHKETNKMDGVPINHQRIDTDRYLKTAICYVIKNPPVGGLPFMAWNYPWSSGSLYFRRTLPWMSVPDNETSPALTIRNLRQVMKSRITMEDVPAMHDGMVFPEEYVAVELVERIFKTAKSYNYFLCTSKEEDVESRSGSISRLSIPMQEMRQHKTEQCRIMFGVSSIKSLSMEQRVRLAKVLKSQYNSSPKQIIRLCGLVYDEAKDLL